MSTELELLKELKLKLNELRNEELKNEEALNFAYGDKCIIEKECNFIEKRLKKLTNIANSSEKLEEEISQTIKSLFLAFIATIALILAISIMTRPSIALVLKVLGIALGANLGGATLFLIPILFNIKLKKNYQKSLNVEKQIKEQTVNLEKSKSEKNEINNKISSLEQIKANLQQQIKITVEKLNFIENKETDVIIEHYKDVEELEKILGDECNIQKIKK